MRISNNVIYSKKMFFLFFMIDLEMEIHTDIECLYFCSLLHSSSLLTSVLHITAECIILQGFVSALIVNINKESSIKPV